MNLKVLLIGDIFGKPGRRVLKKYLAGLVKTLNLDMVVANGENAAGGLGITTGIAQEIHQAGVHVITTGNHVWHKKCFDKKIDELSNFVRPLNYPPGTPGRGIVHYLLPGGTEVIVINLLGRVFMPPIDCPFRAVSKALADLEKAPPAGRIVLVDFHAEATSEKVAMGHFLDGKACLVAGTHTHVQTADERILRNGTAYISDVGFTGPYYSVIGHDKHIAIEQFRAARNLGFVVADGIACLEGIIVEAVPETGLAQSVKRIRIIEEQ